VPRRLYQLGINGDIHPQTLEVFPKKIGHGDTLGSIDRSAHEVGKALDTARHERGPPLDGSARHVAGMHRRALNLLRALRYSHTHMVAPGNRRLYLRNRPCVEHG